SRLLGRIFAIGSSKRDCLAASRVLKLYRIMSDLTAVAIPRVGRLKDRFSPMAHVCLAIAAYRPTLGHFLDTFAVQTCFFLFQNQHTRNHKLLSSALGM